MIAVGTIVRIFGKREPGVVKGDLHSRALGLCYTLRLPASPALGAMRGIYEDREEIQPASTVSPLCADCTTDWDTGHVLSRACKTCDALREAVSA